MREAFHWVVWSMLMTSLSGCSGFSEPDYEGLQEQMKICGTENYHFYQPEMGTIAAAPLDDAVAGVVDQKAQKCVLDWAANHGFKVLSSEELKQLMNDAGI